MIQFAPYVCLAAGAMLLITATMVNVTGLLNGVLFRILPTLIGAASLWMSAALFMAGAA